MNIKYVGPVKDYSGYGEACRHDVGSLLKVGINLTTEIPVYTLEQSDFGKLGHSAIELENKELDYDIIILHVTPNVYGQYIEPGKYHIGRVFWETDKLPPDFSRNLHLLDEIWTGSEYNAQAIRNSGIVNVPIKIITEAIDTDLDIKELKPYTIANENDYKFYSVFEWTERKNPRALLSSFWEEFENEDDVSLTLKTYIDNFTPKKKDEITRYIKKIKSSLSVKKFAPVYVVNRLMDRHQIYRFHRTFDCFVSAHRGEGWGIPQMEAMLLSNPVISTNLGGIHEYLTDKEDALLIDYKVIPLRDNNRNKQWYMHDQNWGDVDTQKLRKAMRFCYENRKKAKKIGENGQKTVKKLFSFDTVGKKMKDRLEEIQKEKKS